MSPRLRSGRCPRGPFPFCSGAWQPVPWAPWFMPPAQNPRKARMATSAFGDLRPASLTHWPFSPNCKDDSANWFNFIFKENDVGIESQWKYRPGGGDLKQFKSSLGDDWFCNYYHISLINRYFMNYGVSDVSLVDYVREAFLICVNKLR